METKVIDLLKKKHFENIEKLWNGRIDPKSVDQVENLIFDVECGGKNQILRLTHSSHRREDEVIAELDWVNYLHENGVNACAPIASKNGKFTEIISVEDSYFIAVVFQRAPGGRVGSENLWDETLVKNWGKTIGGIHVLTKKYDDSHLKVKRQKWSFDESLQKAEEFLPEDMKANVIIAMEKVTAKIEAIPKNVNTYGLIHDDLNPSNFFVHDGEIHVFDFDDCCYNYFLSDIAMSIPFYYSFYKTDKWESILTNFFTNFMAGYLKSNDIDLQLLKIIPDYMRYFNLCSVVFSYEIDEYNRKLYDDWFQEVLHVYQNGHQVFDFDYYGILA